MDRSPLKYPKVLHDYRLFKLSIGRHLRRLNRHRTAISPHQHRRVIRRRRHNFAVWRQTQSPTHPTRRAQSQRST